jgi:hypothetical protein
MFCESFRNGRRRMKRIWNTHLNPPRGEQPEELGALFKSEPADIEFRGRTYDGARVSHSTL